MSLKKISLVLFALLALQAHAEDGHRLWLRGEMPTDVVEKIDSTMPDDDGYRISGHTITARTPMGLLYGRYALMRGEQGESHPYFRLRILNHWDNLDGTIERGYAGGSIFWGTPITENGELRTERYDYSQGKDEDGKSNHTSQLSVLNSQLVKQYAEACASIGINGTVLNNVNASPQVLTAPYINKVKQIADVLRPWGIRVYLSVNFGSPKALGQTRTADPLDPQVRRWWQRKAKELYRQIPDFGGFLVKANSEGQPGPFDYGRTHADGANMLAEALRPYGGIVMWRSFVYGAKHKGEDRVMQAVSEFAELDGQFADNVILQSKNGPLDFQPREPYAPIFDQMSRTRQMAELQITQEYLGQGDHLVFLAPMWKEFFDYVAPSRLEGIAGVANIGLDTNWCGHHFAQANWYAFGRLAWNPSLSSRQIAEEWVRQTFSTENGELRTEGYDYAQGKDEDGKSNHTSQLSVLRSQLLSVLLRSREACVDYMMPLGLHHIFKFDHHMGPEPDGFKAEYPLEWCPVYYHQADSAGIGFDRSSSGTGATAQYREPFRTLYDSPVTCPERYLLWFHHLPWTYRTLSGRTLWEEMQYRYSRGVSEVEDFVRIWQEARPRIDEQRWQEVDEKLHKQLDDAREWRDVCLKYFGSFASPSPHARVENHTMPCRLLPGINERAYSVCLPADYDTSGRSYPVLYLLHGGGCSHTEWADYGRLQHTVDSLTQRGEMEPMVIVCAEANEGGQMIWFDEPEWPFEQYFFNELMPYVAQHYRIDTRPGRCSVAGFSMGGGGAVGYGLRHPDTFSVVYAMSSYLRRQPLAFLKNDPRGEWRQQNVERHNPIRLVSEASEADVARWRQVQWFIDCGDQDFTLDGNKDFAKALRSRGIAYEMRVKAGGHDWNYWRTSLTDALVCVSRWLRSLPQQ